MAFKDIKITVGIILKDTLFLDCLKTSLEGTGTVEPIISSTNTSKFLAQLGKAKLRPAVCLIDFTLPSAYSLIRQIKSNWPKTRILVLLSSYSDYTVDVLIQQRVNGFITRKATIKQLSEAILTVQRKKFYYSAIAKEERFSAIRNREVSISRLTSRQVEFLNHCITSANYAEIADRLEISVRGVDSIRDGLFEKFGVRNRTDLVMEAIRAGIVYVN